MIDRHIHDADAAKQAAAKWITDRDIAEALVNQAENAFRATLSTEDAARLVDAKTRQANYAVAVAAIERAGGPEAFFAAALHTNAVFTTLQRGFEKRVEAIDALLVKRRKALAALRSAKTEAGVIAVEQDSEVIAAHAVVINLTQARNDAAANQSYCANWTPAVRNRAFSELNGALRAPLPA